MFIGKRRADIADAALKQFIRHGDIGPYRVENLLLGHDPASGIDQVEQHIKAFGAQIDIAVRPLELAAGGDDFEPLKMNASQLVSQAANSFAKSF